jgi:hypothetical protein
MVGYQGRVRESRPIRRSISKRVIACEPHAPIASQNQVVEFLRPLAINVELESRTANKSISRRVPNKGESNVLTDLRNKVTKFLRP